MTSQKGGHYQPCSNRQKYFQAKYNHWKKIGNKLPPSTGTSGGRESSPIRPFFLLPRRNQRSYPEKSLQRGKMSFSL
jgi:hypothetical protein